GTQAACRRARTQASSSCEDRYCAIFSWLAPGSGNAVVRKVAITTTESTRFPARQVCTSRLSVDFDVVPTLDPRGLRYAARQRGTRQHRAGFDPGADSRDSAR